MPDADAGTEILNLGRDFPAGFHRDVGSGDRQGSEGRRLRKEAGMADGGRARRYGPTTARKRSPGWTTSCARRLPAIRSYAEWGRGWEIAQNAKPGPKAVRADLLHEAGAHAVQELGYGIAAGVERLVELTATLPVDTVAPGIEFVFAVGPAYFVEIAKLRAARILWAQAVSAFGPRDDGACRMRLHVRTPRRNKSAYDRYTNLLRVTTEAFAAAVGGCDQLTVEPFGFDAHLALNVQRILKEESHLDAVADPAGGSYYIEALTDSLAREAWKLLQQIGGGGRLRQGAGFRLDRQGAGGNSRGAGKGVFRPQARAGRGQQFPRRDGEDAGRRSAGRGARQPAAAGSRGGAVRSRSGGAPPNMRRRRGGIRRCCCSSAAT